MYTVNSLYVRAHALQVAWHQSLGFMRDASTDLDPAQSREPDVLLTFVHLRSTLVAMSPLSNTADVSQSQKDWKMTKEYRNIVREFESLIVNAHSSPQRCGLSPQSIYILQAANLWSGQVTDLSDQKPKQRVDASKWTVKHPRRLQDRLATFARFADTINSSSPQQTAHQVQAAKRKEADVRALINVLQIMSPTTPLVPKSREPPTAAPKPEPRFVAGDPQNGLCSSCLSEAVVHKNPCKKHQYCASCLENVFTMNLKEKSNMKFPPSCCNKPLDIYILAGVLTNGALAQVEEKLQERDTGNARYCIRCSFFIRKEDIKDGAAWCWRCRDDTCATCGELPHQGKCQEDAGIKTILELAKTSQWQRCKRCKFIIERQTGCNHISCVCGYQFCYKCGGKWRTCECPQFDREIVHDGWIMGVDGQPRAGPRLRRRAEDEHAARFIRPIVRAHLDIHDIPPARANVADQRLDELRDDLEAEINAFRADLQALRTPPELEQELDGVQPALPRLPTPVRPAANAIARIRAQLEAATRTLEAAGVPLAAAARTLETAVLERLDDAAVDAAILGEERGHRQAVLRNRIRADWEAAGVNRVPIPEDQGRPVQHQNPEQPQAALPRQRVPFRIHGNRAPITMDPLARGMNTMQGPIARQAPGARPFRPAAPARGREPGNDDIEGQTDPRASTIAHNIAQNRLRRAQMLRQAGTGRDDPILIDINDHGNDGKPTRAVPNPVWQIQAERAASSRAMFPNVNQFAGLPDALDATSQQVRGMLTPRPVDPAAPSRGPWGRPPFQPANPLYNPYVFPGEPTTQWSPPPGLGLNGGITQAHPNLSNSVYGQQPFPADPSQRPVRDGWPTQFMPPQEALSHLRDRPRRDGGDHPMPDAPPAGFTANRQSPVLNRGVSDARTPATTARPRGNFGETILGQPTTDLRNRAETGTNLGWDTLNDMSESMPTDPGPGSAMIDQTENRSEDQMMEDVWEEMVAHANRNPINFRF